LTELINSDGIKDYAIIALDGGMIYDSSEVTNVIIDNKKVMLIPEDRNDKPVFDCSDGGLGFVLINNTDETVLKGLTICNAMSPAVYMKNDSSRLIDCTFKDNHAQIYVESGTPQFKNCSFPGSKEAVVYADVKLNPSARFPVSDSTVAGRAADLLLLAPDHKEITASVEDRNRLGDRSETD